LQPTDSVQSQLQRAAARLELGRRIPLAGFMVALLFPAAARWLDASAPARSLLAAPLYYLVPLGFGLAVLEGARRAGAERGVSGALVSYFVGLVALASVLVFRERYFTLHVSLDATLLGIMIVSALGFAGARCSMSRDSEARLALGDLLIVSPVFLLAYTIRFGVFSEYPRTDLFQAIHVLKAALELTHFDRLNPFTADSYLPVIPSSLGLLVRLFGAAALDSVWFIALLSFFLKFFVLREISGALLETRGQRLLAISVGMCFLSAGMPSNGELAALGSILLFGMLMARARQGMERAMSSSAAVLLSFGAGYAVMHSHPVFLLVVLMALLALYRMPQVSAPAASAFAPGALAFALAPVHRSTIVFLPLALLLPLAIEGLHRLRLRTVTGIALTLTAVVGAFAGAILYLALKLPTDPLHVITLYDTLLSTFLGVQPESNRDLLVGTGPKVALFEIGRVMSPSFVLATSVLVLLAYAVLDGSAASTDGYVARGPAMVKRALCAWVVAVALAGFLLLGLPFAYRAAFYLWVILAAVFSLLALPARSYPRHTTIIAACVLLSTLYFALVLPLGYHCALVFPCPDQPYLERVRPLIAALAAGILLLGTIQASRALLVRKVSDTSLAVALVGLVAIEFAVNQTYFMPYAYGRYFSPDTTSVSHVSVPELSLAAYLSKQDEQVLVSDPVSLANLKALTGLNSIVSFSNLDTLRPEAEAQLRTWLADTLGHEHPRPSDAQRCVSRPPLEIFGPDTSAAEFFYYLRRKQQPEWTGADVLGSFDYGPALLLTPSASAKPGAPRDVSHAWLAGAIDQAYDRITVLLVINNRTLLWAHAAPQPRLAYLPGLEPLPQWLKNSLRARCDARFFGEHFALVRFSL
jgi:hypothetical protein